MSAAGAAGAAPAPAIAEKYSCPANSAIMRIEPVGTYAVQLYFSDGHDTGIYSWDLLYDYGVQQADMWAHYLRRLDEAGASREKP